MHILFKTFEWKRYSSSGVQLELIPSSHLALRSYHFGGVNMKSQQ